MSGPPDTFTVTLARTDRSIVIGPDHTILDAVAEVVPVNFFCRKGECATCVARVLDGIPDHRDSVLSDVARARGRMTICVSRSKTPVLVLDL